MLLKSIHRRKSRKLLLYLLLLLGFLFIWCTLTVFILFLQDTIFGSVSTDSPPLRDPYKGPGVQVVVGHYSGNLPQEKLKNLTEEELNANNYSPKAEWGEGGAAVRLTREEEDVADETFGINQFNLYISDRVSVNRSIPDIRKKACREKVYPDVSTLPTTSIIIVYHNEAFSTLVRTVMSVINRSPLVLLQEIILVDDYSDRKFLRYPTLDNALKHLRVTIKIVRSKERVGLIRARMMGAQEATGDVLTFLDSHCECTIGWLEPLLARIKENRKAVVCPVIDVINDKTFQYQKGIEMFRGGFNWNLQFRWYAMPSPMAKARLIDPASPIESPTMAGGLFSIDRRYFEELGAYDHRMDIWGGENLEISFRIWQCGGRVEILPCSHVGHIFRKASPHDFPGKGSGKILNVNLIRAAEVWMDDWKHLFYKISPQASHLREDIDVSDRVELRKKLFCKNFQWYLDNIFTDHFMPVKGSFFGRIASGRMNCLVSRPGAAGKKEHTLLSSPCTLGFDLWQLWIYSREGRIRSDEHLCLSATQVVHTNAEWIVQLKECAEHEQEYWRYSSRRKTFVHVKSGLCLTDVSSVPKTSKDAVALEIQRCNGVDEQVWTLKSVDWLPDKY